MILLYEFGLQQFKRQADGMWFVPTQKVQSAQAGRCDESAACSLSESHPAVGMSSFAEGNMKTSGSLFAIVHRSLFSRRRGNSYLDRFTVSGYVCGPASSQENFGQGSLRYRVSVNQIELWLIPEIFGPTDQLGLAGMSGKPSERMNTGLDGYIFPTHPESCCAVYQGPPRRAARLKADEDDVGVFSPQVVLQVVADTTAVAHAAAGDDHSAGFYSVQRHRLFS
jgi:hypothetical protein